MYQAVFEGNHAYIARSLRAVGLAYNQLGRYGDALMYHSQALAMRQALFTAEHPKVLQSQQDVDRT